MPRSLPAPRSTPATRAAAWLASGPPGASGLAAAGKGVIDGLGDILALLSVRAAPLEPDRLVARAMARTGLSSLGEDALPEGFSIACDSIAREAGLGLFGRLAVSEMLVSAVENRLRYVDARARVPQRFAVDLRPPLFVVGLPRSGTTFLHRLLCAVPGHRGVPLWEAKQPIVRGVDRRRARMAWMLAGLRVSVPEVQAKHAFELDSPEEAVSLFEAAHGWNPAWWRFTRCPTYLRWVLGHDARGPYGVFVDLLRWIGAPTPEQRLVLKTPNHLGYLDVLHELLPDAVFVRCHRDPARCVPSYASLASSMHRAAARTDAPGVVGAVSLELWAHHHASAQRASVPVIDVDYDELVADPVGVVTAVLAVAGVPMTPTVHEQVAAEVARRPQGRHGVHVYSAERFGLTEDGVRAAFETG